MDNGWLLAQKTEIEAIKAEIQGMIAKNQYWMSMYEKVHYDEDAFQEKAQELRSVGNSIMENR